MKIIGIAAAGVLALGADCLGADEVEVPAFTQKLGATVPLERSFRDASGEMRRLGEFFGQRPVVLVLGYYECPMLCSLVSDGLLQALRELEFNVGRDFDLLHVSIDPGETSTLAAQKRERYLQRYGRPGSDQGWHFLTGTNEANRALAETVGFAYRYDRERDQYAHPSGIVVLTPDGRVSSYLFGIQFPERDLRLALVEAADARIGSPIDQLLLLCYHYEPLQGKYGALILGSLKVLALATLFFIGWSVWRMRQRERKAGQ